MRPSTLKSDTLWFLAVALLILGFSAIPYWAGHAAQTDEMRFAGIFSDEQDYAVHISMMHAGELGEWAYRMRFTSEPSTPAFIRMFYIALGHAGKWLGLKTETMYQIARWGLGLPALYMIYQLCLSTLPGRAYAKTAFLLASLGSGAGWLQLMLGVPLRPISPIDFWLVDTYVFFSIALFPSFAFTLALMVGALKLYGDFLETHNWRHIWLIGILAVFSQMTNPIAFAPINLAFLGMTLISWWRKREVSATLLGALSALAAVQVPLLVYNYVILSHDPAWSQFTLQNQTPSPPPLYYFWGLAPFYPFAIYGIVRAFYERNTRVFGMVTWSLAALVFAYLPVAIQRRFTIGLTIPLGILAVYGLSQLIMTAGEKWQWLPRKSAIISFAYVLIAAISTLYLILGSSMFLASRPEKSFYSEDLEKTFLWLNQNAPPNEFVLSSERTGQLTAQRTNLKVYLGHEMETLHYEEKIALVTDYYRGSGSPDWLAGETAVKWVIYGPYERALAEDFIPPPELKLVYKNETVELYNVTGD